MTSNDFGVETAEPMVGEVTALRSFRVTDDGYLLPLTDAGGDAPWPTETSSAVCNRGRSHTAPDPECTCGFYAYGNRAWVEQYGPYAWSRLVLAAVHCSGRLVAGEKGLRGERMRLVACYVHKGFPQGVLDLLREHYPEVEFFTSRRALLSEHPETHLSTYDDPPKGLRLRVPTLALQIALSLILVPIMAYFLFGALTGTQASTYGSVATVGFAVLVWTPLILEGWVALRTGVPSDRLESMRRVLQIPWTLSRRGLAAKGPIFRLAMILVGVPFIFLYANRPLLPAGWPTLTLSLWLMGVACSVVLEVRRIFPAGGHLPLAPRTLAVQQLRDSLPGDVSTSRQAPHRHRVSGGECVIEALDMGGYGVGMIHYGIFSDPEDHAPARGSAPTLTRAMSELMKSLGIPSGCWVAYIASEKATVRVLSPKGKVSVPVPLAEVDAILPFPTLAWCAPGVRASYVSKVSAGRLKEGPGPHVLPAGYREGRSSGDAFSDPSIGNALNIARRRSEQFAYRTFKEIEANLPEGVEPLATPLLPSEEGGSSQDSEAEMTRALVTLMAARSNPSTAKSLTFAMVELIDALSTFNGDINEFMRIDSSPSRVEGDAPSNAEEGMRGGHLLLLGGIGAILSEVFTPLTYDSAEGRVYAIFDKATDAPRALNASLTVSAMQSESGGDDDVDALEDAGE